MTTTMTEGIIAGVTRDEFAALVKHADAGDDEALATLRQILDDSPAIWQVAGDIGRTAEQGIIRAIAGSSRSTEELLRRNIADLRQRLLGSDPSPAEELAIARIIVCWLEIQTLDQLYPAPVHEMLPRVATLFKIKESAQRRFNAALKGLETARRLLPSMPASEPNAAKTNGEAQSRAARDGLEKVNGNSVPISRINGHLRELVPAGADGG